MNLLKTFFYSLKKSFSDPKYYQDIVQANFWFSFKYLWFLLFIFVFIQGLFLGGKYIKKRPFIQSNINKAIDYADKIYPPYLEIKIKNGRLSTNVREPYAFYLNSKELSENKSILVIDTNGSIENYPKYNTYILVTKNAVVYPSGSGNNELDRISVFFLPKLKEEIVLNKKLVDEFINEIKPYAYKVIYFIDWIVLIGILMFIIFWPFIRLINMMFTLLILIFFIWLINLIFKKGYNYKTLYRIGMHAVTWPITITEVGKYLSITIPGVFPVTLFIYFFIVLFL